MSVDQRIVQATVQLEADVEKTYNIVNGDEDTVVDTEGGPVPSHAKVAKDSHDEIIALLEPTVDNINEHADYVDGKVTETNTNATRAETAAENAEAIVYEGDATVEPTPGSIPIADGNAKIHHGWLPDQSVPHPDFWLPLNDSLKIEAGFGDYDQIDVSQDQDGSVLVDLPSRSASITRSTTASCTSKSGKLETNEIDIPRIEKDGILIEGGATNFLIYSEDLELADKFYTTGSMSISPIREGEPRPLSNELGWTDKEKSAYCRFTIGGESVEGEVVGSIFIKIQSGSSVNIGVVERAGDNYVYFRRLVDLRYGDDQFQTEYIGDGLYRVSSEWDCGTGEVTNSSGFEVSFREGSGPVNTPIYVGGWQVQTKSSSSRSYIATTDTPFTKKSDTSKIQTENNLPDKQSPFSIVGTVSVNRDTETFLPIIGTYESDGFSIYIQFGQLRAQPNTETDSAYITDIPREFIFACIFDGVNTTLYADGRSSTTPYNGSLIFYDEVMIGGARMTGQRLCGNLKNLSIHHMVFSESQLSELGVLI